MGQLRVCLCIFNTTIGAPAVGPASMYDQGSCSCDCNQDGDWRVPRITYLSINSSTSENMVVEIERSWNKWHFFVNTLCVKVASPHHSILAIYGAQIAIDTGRHQIRIDIFSSRRSVRVFKLQCFLTSELVWTRDKYPADVNS